MCRGDSTRLLLSYQFSILHMGLTWNRLGASLVTMHSVNRDDVNSTETLNAEEISSMTFEDALAMVNAPAFVLA